VVIAKNKSPFDLATEGALIEIDLSSTLRSREASQGAVFSRGAVEMILFRRDHRDAHLSQP
jgi:hypothetical protein